MEPQTHQTESDRQPYAPFRRLEAPSAHVSLPLPTLSPWHVFALPGGERRGIVLEDDGDPLPIGCMSLFNVEQSSTTHKRKIIDSSEAVREGETDEVAVAMRGMARSSIKASALNKDGKIIAAVKDEPATDRGTG